MSTMSQTTVDKEIERIKQEKIRFDIKELINAVKENRPINHKKLKLKNDQILEENGKIAEKDEVESEVHAAINPNDPNNIIVSPIRQNYQNPENALSCPVYYTTDMGDTWLESEFVTKTHKDEIMIVGGGDPVLTFDNNGRAYLSWIALGLELSGQFNPDSAHAAIYWAYSDDKGATWTTPENNFIYYKSAEASFMSLLNPIIDIGEMGDKQWMATDRTEGPFKNSVYTSFVKIGYDMETGEQKANMYLGYKRENSDAFSESHTLFSNNEYDLTQFGSLDVDANGDVHVTFFARKGSKSFLYHNKSTDGGITFGIEKQITEFIIDGGQFSPNPNSTDTIVGIISQRLYPSPYMAVDKRVGKNNLYLTWTGDGIDSKGNHGKDIYFVRSTNGGESWEKPYVLNNDNKDRKTSNFYPNITVNDDGYVVVTWYDRRNDNMDVETDHYIAISENEGQSFDIQQKISTQSTDFETVGNLNQGFGIGEYNAVVANDEYACAIWADGRSNNGLLAIYFAKVRFDGQSTSVESVSNISSDVKIQNIYPNPAKESITLDLELQTAKNLIISLKDLNGRTVLNLSNQNYPEGNISIDYDLNSLSQANYYLHIEHDQGFEVRRINVVK
jgi:hypothetical protein